MHTNEGLLALIIEQCKEMGVTGYDIAKNTSISDQAAYKILNGVTKNPRRKNLLEIRDYLEKRQLGRNLDKDGNKIVSEPEPEYKTEEPKDLLDRHLKLGDDFRKLMMDYQKLLIENQYLKRLLDKNKIEYTEDL